MFVFYFKILDVKEPGFQLGKMFMSIVVKYELHELKLVNSHGRNSFALSSNEVNAFFFLARS
jgi:hypothetical protein